MANKLTESESRTAKSSRNSDASTMSEEDAGEKRPPLGFSCHAAFEHSRWIAAGLLALSVATVLAILSGPGIAIAAERRALEFFSIAIPAVSLHLLVLSAAEHRPYAPGILIKLITTTGLICAVIGLGCAIWSLLPMAGIIFTIATVICVACAQRAETRGRKLQGRRQ